MRNLARNDALTGEVQGLAAMIADPWALDWWLRRNWRIVPDPPDAELIRSPAYVIRCNCYEGDCDDASTLAASVLYALGYPSCFIAVRQLSEPEFSHVFTRVLVNPPVDIDPIVPAELMPIQYGEAMVLTV